LTVFTLTAAGTLFSVCLLTTETVSIARFSLRTMLYRRAISAGSWSVRWALKCTTCSPMSIEEDSSGSAWGPATSVAGPPQAVSNDRTDTAAVLLADLISHPPEVMAQCMPEL
jgi:hypothetical protein